MAKRPGKQIAEATAEPLTKGDEAGEKIVKGNAAEALTVSANASRAAVQELTRAYQELATKNAKNLTAAMQALALLGRSCNASCGQQPATGTAQIASSPCSSQ